MYDLELTWKNQLSMSRWVAKQWKLGRRNTWALKREWLQRHKFEDNMRSDCFFCQYNSERSNIGCRTCPARYIDDSFLCSNTEYHWQSDPVALYNKLRSINRKRLIALRKEQQNA